MKLFNYLIFYVCVHGLMIPFFEFKQNLCEGLQSELNFFFGCTFTKRKSEPTDIFANFWTNGSYHIGAFAVATLTSTLRSYHHPPSREFEHQEFAWNFRKSDIDIVG